MATQLSAVSFCCPRRFSSACAMAVECKWLTYELGVPLAMIPLMALIGPMLRRSGVVSGLLIPRAAFRSRFAPAAERVVSFSVARSAPACRST